MKRKGLTVIDELVFLIFALVFIAGWVQNIYKLTECDFEAPYTAEIIHGIGVIPVIGAITGWIDVGN